MGVLYYKLLYSNISSVSYKLGNVRSCQSYAIESAVLEGYSGTWVQSVSSLELATYELSCSVRTAECIA